MSKRKRSLESTLDDLVADMELGDDLGIADAVDWLEHVRKHGADADPPAVYFGRPAPISWDPVAFSPAVEAALDDPEMDRGRWNSAELYGLRYAEGEHGEAIRVRREAVEAEEEGEQ